MNQSILEAKILIVDDNEDNVSLLEQMLRGAGYSALHSTTDSRQAVSMVEALSPDVLILDLLMPPPDGFAVLDQLVVSPKRDKLMPVLVLTSDVVPSTRVRAYGKGAKEFLNEPVDRVELLIRIRTLLDCRLARKQALTEKAMRLSAETSSGFTDAEDAVMQMLSTVAACLDFERDLAGARVADLAVQIGFELNLDSAVLSVFEGLPDFMTLAWQLFLALFDGVVKTLPPNSVRT